MQHKEKVLKTMVKEMKHNCMMMFPSWIARFVQHLHLSPIAMLIKLGKNDRLVFDASAHPSPEAKATNDMVTDDTEPFIDFPLH